MKKETLTLIKHKLQWLALLVALLGISQGVWGTYYVAGNGTGTWCGGNYWVVNGSEMSGSGTSDDPAKVTFSNVSPNEDLEFKVTDGSWNTTYGWSDFSSDLSTLVGTTNKGAAGENVKLLTYQELNITIYFNGTNIYVKTEFCPYYYRGSDNSWGATQMEAGSDGYYCYIQSSNSDNQFKISTTTSTYDYNYNYVSAGYNSYQNYTNNSNYHLHNHLCQ